jgi:hypothetical protein
MSWIKCTCVRPCLDNLLTNGSLGSLVGCGRNRIPFFDRFPSTSSISASSWPDPWPACPFDTIMVFSCGDDILACGVLRESTALEARRGVPTEKRRSTELVEQKEDVGKDGIPCYQPHAVLVSCPSACSNRHRVPGLQQKLFR